MGDEMADVERKGQITPREWAESQFLRATVAWNELSWKAKGATVGGLLFLGGIAGWRFYEGRIGPPTVPPVEDKETTEIPQTQVETLDIAVPSEVKTAPEYIRRIPVEIEEKVPIEEVSVERTVEFLEGLQKKVDEIYDLRENWIGGYIVQKGDTLWNIAQKYETSVERLLYLNPEIKAEAIIPEQELTVPKLIVPTPFLGEIFKRLESDQQRLQDLIDSGQSGDLEAKITAKEIMGYWNTAPGEGEDVPEPEIIIEPKAEQGDWIKSQLEEMIALIPNFGRIVARIEIKPTGEWGHPEGMYSYKDKGATIHIYDKSWFGKPWTKDSLLDKFAHGALGHAASIYSEGYNLRFLTPVEIIELVHEDTIIWDKISLLDGERRKIDEGEGEASQVQYFLYNDEGIIANKELAQRRLDYFAKLFSRTFEAEITIPELGRKLGIRRE